MRLFLRLTRRLRLTEAGSRLYTTLNDSFAQIAATLADLRADAGAGPLGVGLTSYFAARWLTRRIGRFAATHPDIELRLHLSNEPAAFDRMELDAAIAWGRVDRPGLVSELLMRSRIIAVCAPDLVESAHPLDSVQDLMHYPILHEVDRGLWRHWLGRVGEPDAALGPAVIMDDPNIVHQAAVEGQGVALGLEEHVTEEISEGRLRRLFGTEAALDGAYYLVTPEGAADRPRIKAFRDWLMREAGGI